MSCLKCGKLDVRYCQIDGKPGWYCTGCGEAVIATDTSEYPPAPPTPTLKLPGLSRGKQSKRTAIVEEDASEAVILFLRTHGYEVFDTTTKRKRVQCSQCGEWMWPKGGTGVTKGIADLLVTHDNWPPCVLMALELKGTSTALSHEQADLLVRRRICVLRAENSLDHTCSEALRMVHEFEEALGKAIEK